MADTDTTIIYATQMDNSIMEAAVMDALYITDDNKYTTTNTGTKPVGFVVKVPSVETGCVLEAVIY